MHNSRDIKNASKWRFQVRKAHAGFWQFSCILNMLHSTSLKPFLVLTNGYPCNLQPWFPPQTMFQPSFSLIGNSVSLGWSTGRVISYQADSLLRELELLLRDSPWRCSHISPHFTSDYSPFVGIMSVNISVMEHLFAYSLYYSIIWVLMLNYTKLSYISRQNNNHCQGFPAR